MYNINKTSNQLRWVILLLAVAVILPTVCLLWFMTQAVKNERLAVRQKLIDIYKEKTEPLIKQLREKRVKFEQAIRDADQSDPFAFFVEFCHEKKYADGILIYDSDNHILFPKPPEKVYFIDTEIFEKGWKLEFIDNNYLEAASEYEQAIKFSSIPYEVFRGKLAIIRCYEKAKSIEKAVDTCRELAYPGEHIISEYRSSDIIQAKLKLVQLYQKFDHSVFKKEVTQLLSDVMDNLYKNPPSSEARVFVLNELLKLIDKAGLRQRQQENVTKAETILRAEKLSLYTFENILPQMVLDKVQEESIEPIDLAPKTYGVLFKTENRKVVLVSQRSSIVRVMTYIAEKLSDSTAVVGVFDEYNNLVFGKNQDTQKAFLTIRPSPYLSKWKLCFFFHNSEVFDLAASRQTTIYRWTGILVALLILSSGAIAVQVITRQIKLNKLKNDFIATVTHELKTPLSSMRVLVDTLLEGNYNDKEQATEYLQLISKENVRLSRLIDNFLTFSRMERNKQAFDIVKTSPAEIAKCAAEAVQTKFNHESCKLSVAIENNLPLIMADKDAMITVLVNLLDNAYKYSYDNKQVDLKVFAQEAKICFSVKDNGIGMTRRQMKKVFDRFYQADNSLSRQAEGTGLGLSIVKFIVNAHKGQITVESTLGEGSTFTVILS